MESRNLTIMMTDIQGFTQRTSTMSRDGIENLLHVHEQLLSPIFAEYGGTVIKTIGDAFLVTFPSATRAVHAGMQIQRVLSAHNVRVPDVERLRVRVVLNAGEVNVRDGDVFGEPVNVTARVEGVGEAGHVTFTDAVRLFLAEDAVPVEELGEYDLKGIPAPVRLFRLVPDWATSFPSAPSGAESSSPAPTAPSGAVASSSSSSAATAPAVASPSHPSSSKTWKGMLVTAVAVAAIAAAMHLLPSMASDPLTGARALAEEGRWKDAADAAGLVVASAPGNEAARALLRRCRLELLRTATTASDWASGLAAGQALLAADVRDADARAALLALCGARIAVAERDGSSAEAHALLMAAASALRDDEALVPFRVRLGMTSLRRAYGAGQAVRSAGAQAALKVWREAGYWPTVQELRRLNLRDPELDWYEARFLMTRLAAMTPSEYYSASSYERPDVDTILARYGAALEGLPAFRERRDALDDLVAMARVAPVRENLDDTTRRLRRLMVTHHAGWAAEGLRPSASAPVDPAQGPKALDAAWNLRHTARAILADLGQASKSDHAAWLRLDLAWLEADPDNDALFSERVEEVVAGVGMAKDERLRTEAAEALRRMAGSASHGWSENLHQSLVALGAATPADDLAWYEAELRYSVDTVLHHHTGEPQEWAVNRFTKFAELTGGLAGGPEKAAAAAMLAGLRPKTEATHPPLLVPLDAALARLKTVD